nr:DUF397 domain-containing protein [Streptomyces mutabilis]
MWPCLRASRGSSSSGCWRKRHASHRSEPITWRKSSYSNQDGGNRVEVAPDIPSLVPVRDSKDPSRGALLFTAPAWAAFVGGVRREAAGRAA